MRWFRSRLHDEETLGTELERVMARTPGIGEHVVRYRSLAKGSGLVVGHAELPDRRTYRELLVALARVLGEDGGRVTLVLTASTPDAPVLEPADVGLFAKPSAAHVLEHLGADPPVDGDGDEGDTRV